MTPKHVAGRVPRLELGHPHPRRQPPITKRARCRRPRPWRRALATFVDVVVYLALLGVFVAPLSMELLSWLSAPDGGALVELVSEQRRVAIAALLLAPLVWLAYFLIGWGWLSATPGMWLSGLVMVDHRGRRPIGLARALLRLAAYSVSACLLGHLRAFGPRGQTLQDHLAGTRVWRRRSKRSMAVDPDPEIDPASNI